MPDFNRFMNEYGPPAEPEKAEPKLLEEYKGVVPDQMIEFWEKFGFASYADGLLWAINPKQLEDVLTEWFPENPEPPRAVPIVRTALGKVIYWHKDKFHLLDVNHNNRFEAGDNVEIIFDYFLVGEAARRSILQELLFKEALKKFGPLRRDEMYGFKLPLAMGGNYDLDNMEKMKLREQLSILAQVHLG